MPMEAVLREKFLGLGKNVFSSAKSLLKNVGAWRAPPKFLGWDRLAVKVLEFFHAGNGRKDPVNCS